MRDVLKDIFGKDTDHARARQNAEEVAILLRTKVVSNDKFVIGEPFCPFKMSVHTKEFFCVVFISDVSYRFTANRRPRTHHIGDFFISLKFSDPQMGARISVEKAAKKLGVGVFRQPFCPERYIQKVFSGKLPEFLSKIDFSRISLFHISPVQLGVVGSLVSAEFCAAQALVFRELMTVTIQEAYERNKDALGFPDAGPNDDEERR
jgi:hypothetical protein